MKYKEIIDKMQTQNFLQSNIFFGMMNFNNYLKMISIYQMNSEIGRFDN